MTFVDGLRDVGTKVGIYEDRNGVNQLFAFEPAAIDREFAILTIFISP